MVSCNKLSQQICGCEVEGTDEKAALVYYFKENGQPGNDGIFVSIQTNWKMLIVRLSQKSIFFSMWTKKIVNQQCGEGAPSSNNCCTPDKPCDVGMGNCNGNDDCVGNLICGDKNCGTGFLKDDNCCEVNEDDSDGEFAIDW